MSRTLLLLLAALLVSPTLALAQTPPVTAPPPSAPVVSAFPADTRIAFVNLDRIFSESAFGKDGLAKVTALQTSLNSGLQVRAKDIQALSDKIKSQQGIVAETTLLTWNSDLLRLQREAQFAQQEAQIQVEQFQGTLLANFEKLVQPVIETVRKERGLWFVFALPTPNAEATGLTLLAADPALDLTAEVARRLSR